MMAGQAPDPRDGGPRTRGPQPYGPRARGPQSAPPARGIPDGAIVGLLAILLGTTALVWTATALAGLITHGHLPHPLPFEGTPTAIRGLATEPNQLAAAWPGTPAAELPSPTAFWATFFVLLALLITLALTILTAWTRLRRAAAAADTPTRGAPAPDDDARDPRYQQPYQQPHRQPTYEQRYQQPPYEPRRDRGEGGVDPVGGYQGGRPRTDLSKGGQRPPQPPAPPAPAQVPGALQDPGWPTAPEFPTPRQMPGQAGRQDPPADERFTAVGSVDGDTVEERTGPVAPSARPRSTASARSFAFPPGAVCLLAPDPVGSAGARRRLLQRALQQATGAVLVVSDDLALWDSLPAHRDARLFDPLRLTDADSETRVRWAPHDRCEDPAVALARARALLAPTTRPGNAPGEQGVQEAAQTLLRCWLHAAALDRRPFRHVLRWAGGTARQEAVTILRTADPHVAAPGWSGELQAVLANPGEVRDGALDRVLAALDVLSDLHVLKACTPESAHDALDVEWFLRNRGTLFLTGRAEESRVSRSAHSAMPLLTALVEDVVELGRRMAVRSSSGRLDPPLLCVLDSVAAVSPFPGLPDLMARGGPLGLNTIAVLRSPEQARARWGDRAVHSLWTSADARAVLGPTTGPVLGPTPDADPAEDLADDELLLLRPRHPAERHLLPPGVASSEPSAANT